MTKGPNDCAERAARTFNRRVHYGARFSFGDGLAIREKVIFDSTVLMPSAEQQEG